MNKRGLEVVVTTVLMIILSLAVLTALLLFLNSQTGFLNRFFETQTSENNVDSFVSYCNSLETSQSVYTYCCEEKEVFFGDDSPSVKVTCDSARGLNWSSGRISELGCSSVVCN